MKKKTVTQCAEPIAKSNDVYIVDVCSRRTFSLESLLLVWIFAFLCVPNDFGKSDSEP